MTLQNPEDPKFGSKLSASEFRELVTNPLYANDLALEQRIANIEAAMAALPEDFRQASVPESAIVNDRWWDSSGQLWLCIGAYGISDPDKEANWIAAVDATARSTASAAQTAAGTATKTVISATVPSDFTRGWRWVDEGSSNREMLCVASYVVTDGPGGYATVEEYRKAQFAPADTYQGSLLAAAEQGLKDGKTNMIMSNSVPDSADGRDTWIDTDANNAAYACLAGYLSTDHSPFDSNRAYEHNEIVTYGGKHYEAKVGGAPQGQLPTNTTYWTDLGSEFANVTLFRESRWVPTADEVARGLAAAAQATADSKVNAYRGTNFPASASIGDTFFNTNTQQSYSCNTTHTGGPTEANWDEIYDKVARDAYFAQLALADGQIDTFLQASIPTDASNGDVWIRTPDFAQFKANTNYSGGGNMGHWDTITLGANAKTYNSATMPEAASLSDVWYKSDEDRKQYICVQAYSSGGTIGVNWLPTNDNKRSIYVQADPPNEADVGDAWLDTDTVSGQYQFYLCNDSYSNGSHGWTSISNSGKWTPSKDIQTETTANLALNVASGQTTSYVQDNIPSSANKGDFWIDTDNFKPDGIANYSYICNRSYTGGSGLQADWDEYSNPVVEKLAVDARTVADGKRKIIYDSEANLANYAPFDLGDGWVDTATNVMKVVTSVSPLVWGDTTNADAKQALELASQAGVAATRSVTAFDTDGTNDSGWPGPGGFGSQWGLGADWPSGGAKVGDIWRHIDTSSSTTYIRYCNTAYSGVSGSGGDIGQKAYWSDFIAATVTTDISDLQSDVSNLTSGKVDKSNGSFTNLAKMGSSTLNNSPPTANNHLTRKDWVDGQIDTRMPKSGGTFTGAPQYASDPTANNHLTRRSWVNTQLGGKASLAGATFTGAPQWGSNPTADNHLCRKGYVDSALSVEGKGDVSKIGTSSNSSEGVVYNSGRKVIGVAKIINDELSPISVYDYAFQIYYDSSVNNAVIIKVVESRFTPDTNNFDIDYHIHDLSSSSSASFGALQLFRASYNTSQMTITFSTINYGENHGWISWHQILDNA